MRYAAQSLIAGLILSSCSVLPPGMRGEEKKAEAAPLTPIVIQPPMVAPPSTANTQAETKTYSGTGNFVNTRPPHNNADPGPEEATCARSRR